MALLNQAGLTEHSIRQNFLPLLRAQSDMEGRPPGKGQGHHHIITWSFRDSPHQLLNWHLLFPPKSSINSGVSISRRPRWLQCERASSLELTDSCSRLTRASQKTLVTGCWWGRYKMAELVMTHISIIASEGVNEAALEWEQAAQANSCIDINRAARIRGSTRNTLKSCLIVRVFCFCFKRNVKMRLLFFLFHAC